ncbi:hypothetical protein Cgig2_013795 [Carnegiea gigantea]|uniref:Uncharacterized protein n=1 Tax=Carnegiea gigantea TaxID=171969 RepID=A0A9Q1GSI6_9CARY|nr:hypothetical protein Cgig2_013795 [Carnegiea gigantea]
MEDGLRQLKNDFDALDKAVVAREEKKINVYIVHSINEPQIIPPALFTDGFEDFRPDSPITWHKLFGGDAILDSSRGSEYVPNSDELEFSNNNEVVLSNLRKKKSNDEWEVAKNRLVEFKKWREIEAERLSASQGVKAHVEDNRKLMTMKLHRLSLTHLIEEDNKILSKRNLKKGLKVDEHTNFKKLQWEGDVIVNDMAEMLRAKHKIYILEYIRVALMERVVVKSCHRALLPPMHQLLRLMQG